MGAKKGRWNTYFETHDGRMLSHQQSDAKPEAFPKEIMDALKDGIYDGKFKKANQELLADYFNIQIKSNGKRKTK